MAVRLISFWFDTSLWMRVPNYYEFSLAITVSRQPCHEGRVCCRYRKSQIRKFLKTKDLVPVVGLEPTT
jgi:hypothetical protein